MRASEINEKAKKLISNTYLVLFRIDEKTYWQGNYQERYDALTSALEELKGVELPTTSDWMLISSKSAKQILLSLKTHISKQDKLMVVEISEDAVEKNY